MKKILLSALLCYSPLTLAESVAILRYTPVYTAENVAPNSIFWIETPQNDNTPYLLKSGKQQIRLIAQTPISHIQATPFKPETPLITGQTYTLNTAEKSERFANELTYHYPVKQHTTTANIQWSAPPKLEHIEFFEHSNDLILKFSTQMQFNPKDYLIQVRIAPLHIFAGETAHIIIPTVDDQNKVLFKLNLDPKTMTLFNSDLRGDILKIKFDLIRYDGKVFLWQGKAVKYIVKKLNK
ncbi:hypothetical protein BEN71_17760 [Acinetobacter wuhouensis]|uniref:hypothetical protein n=1 Tax=Acinetobacter wuhouensis TaxID=1879050 RepID=UPI00083A79FB|nr:hypothetical protein [Acinetobacter wuhouensis]AXQ23797.1 hypothetical protein BEN71_17760 [Acinetobacter wuhouensis]